MIKINEDYKPLIDLALDLKDFEWAKELLNKKNTELLHNEYKQINKTEYKAFSSMNNKTPVYLEENVAKFPLSIDKLNNEIVLAISKNNNKHIKENEIIAIKHISEEEQLLYRMFYQGYFQGYELAYNYYNNLEQENNLLKQRIEVYKQTEILNKNNLKSKDEYIKLLNSIIDSYKTLINKKKWWQFWK